jgi:hypothetical protein
MTNHVPGPAGPSDAVHGNGNIAEDVQVLPERSAATLLSGIISDAQHLIQQQLAMFRQEIRDDVRKGKQAIVPLAVGIGITAVGGVFLLLMLPLLLHWAVPALPLWACFGILGGVLATLGGALVYAGVRKIESLDLLSNQAVEAFKENLTWTTKPT